MKVAIVAASAVITKQPDGWQPDDSWAVVQPSQTARTCSPAALYARDAVARLPSLGPDTAMITVMGATGMTADVFTKARGPRQLVDDDFGRSRYKRIHPFTLVRSLQNQAASELSMFFGTRGPCLNMIDGEMSVAQVPLHASAMLVRSSQVLLVFVSAPHRGEELRKCEQLAKPGLVAEGAAAFLIRRGAGLGYLEATIHPQQSGDRVNCGGVPVVSPVVRVGWQLFQHIHAQQAGSVNLVDGVRSQALHWRPF